MNNRSDGSPSALPRRLAKALILWEERISEDCRGPVNASLLRLFAAHFRTIPTTEENAISLTDLDERLKRFVGEHGALVNWYGALLPIDIGIEWSGGEPHIDPDCVLDWERLCEEFDSDALLTFDLARRYEGIGIAKTDLSHWSTIARVTDRDLEALYAEGLSDLHIHVAGTRLPQLAWQELLAEEVGAEVYRFIASKYEAADRSLNDDIAKARAAWEGLRAHAGLAKFDRSLLRPTSSRWWRSWPSVREDERWMLLKAWTTLLSAESDAKLLRTMDNYLSHKHRFVQLVRQRTFSSPPGLRYFDIDLFSSLKKAKARAPTTYFGYGMSPRLEMTQYGDACRFLLECKHLRRLELRIAPFGQASEYFRLFELWADLKMQLVSEMPDRPVLDIRFAVHFKRTREPEQSDPDAMLKLAALDRQTVALRLALSDPDLRRRSWMSVLARIDVAGQERDTPLSLFVKHLRLLRGDPEAIAYFRSLTPDDPFCRWLGCWSRLKGRPELVPGVNAPQLGLTVHAGEDFADLLDGLYQIGTALDGLAMRAGDTIGHALALKSRAVAEREIPNGVAFDSLCWLLYFSERHGGQYQHRATCERLRSLIRETASQVYDVIPNWDRSASASDHVWVWQHSVFPLSPNGGSRIQRELLQRNWERPVMINRERKYTVGIARRELDPLVLWAQRLLLAQIRERRIVIEMNPSSNLRISGASSSEHSPTVGIFRAVASGLLACVNTDNPGVFTTCIENEYALLLDGAKRSGMSNARARKLLESVRRIGMLNVH
jgi:Adenosine deaminase